MRESSRGRAGLPDFPEAIGRWLEESSMRRAASADSGSGDTATRELEAAIEELRVTQEELVAQNEEIGATNRELEQERLRYRELFDFAPDAYVATDADGVIIQANRAAESLLRAASPVLEGQKLELFLPESERSAFRARLSRLGRFERIDDWEVTLQPHGGEATPVAITAVASHSESRGGTQLRWLARDVTDRRQVEEAIRRLEWERVAREASEVTHGRAIFLANASRSLAQCVSFRDIVEETPRLAVRMLADYCLLDWVDEKGRIRRLAGAHTDPERAALLSTLIVAAPMDDVDVRGAVEKGESEIHDYADRPAGAADNAADLVRAELGTLRETIIPLYRRDRVVGALTLGHVDGGCAVQPLPLAESFADRVALAVDHALMYEEARAARRVAEAANESKAVFLEALSHDIRTPLSSCLGYVELMMEGIPEPLPETLQPHAHGIHASVRHQIGLVEDILQFARLDQIGDHVEVVDVDLRALAADVADLMRPQADSAHLFFDVRLPPQPVPAVTDPAKLSQVLSNLISNAIRFTDEGAVSVKLEVEGRDAIFEISDTGVGIPEDELGQIFDRNWRGSSTAGTAGTGLGLSIVRRLVTLLGGTVEVSSEVGAGSTFRLRLPLGSRVRTGDDRVVEPVGPGVGGRPEDTRRWRSV